MQNYWLSRATLVFALMLDNLDAFKQASKRGDFDAASFRSISHTLDAPYVVFRLRADRLNRDLFAAALRVNGWIATGRNSEGITVIAPYDPQ